MLQSLSKTVRQTEFTGLAKKKYQRHRRLSTAYENGLIEPQEHDMTPRNIYQKSHHRRHLSVPECSAILGSHQHTHFGLDNFLHGTIGLYPGENQHSPILNHCSDGIMLTGSENHDENDTTCSTEISDHKTKIKQARKRNIKKMTLHNSRPSSLTHDTLRDTSLKGPNEPSTIISSTIIQQEIYINNDQTFPTPPNTAPLLSMNHFDIATLSPQHFINLSKLTMETPENELNDSYFQSANILSPTFTQDNSEIHQLVFDNNMQQITDDFAGLPSPIVSSTPTAQTASPNEPVHVSSSNHDVESFNNDLIPIPSGVTQDDISMYISGPDPVDGKWLCLYNECGKRFGRKENIKSHVQTHLGDRQFKCHVCRKCFVRQHDLKRHSKIHTGIKPYPCLCGNAFARHDALTRHRQRGMCIGAFEGVVKKVVKRGRPRKKPLPKGISTAEDGSDSVINLSFSSSSDSTLFHNLRNSEFQPTSPSPTPSHDAESLSNFAPDMDSPDYTPPTSPGLDCDPLASQSTDLFTLDNLSEDPLMQSSDTSTLSSSTASSSSTSITAFTGPVRKNATTFHGTEYHFSPSLDMAMFTQHGDLLELTALERDPTMLGFGENFLMKQEITDPESNFFDDQ